jgi:LCP family protein required for cell wall assembly
MPELEKIKKHTTKQEKAKKINWKNVLIISLAVIALIILLFFGLYHLAVEYYLGKINIVTNEPGLVFDTQLPTDVEQVQPEVDYHGQLNKDNLPLICDSENAEVTNILLMATDTRDGKAGLTDSMILLSVNNRTKKVVLCSFMRDMLVYYPEQPSSKLSGKYYKINHAHNTGGPELTLAVLKENFNIDINYYAKVDFTAFVSIADTMGGIEMELTRGEVNFINDVLQSKEINTLFPDHEKTLLPYKAGTYKLTGLQALAHARNRRLGSDFARTERQRDLITQMMAQAGDLSLGQFKALLDNTLPMITTNIPKDVLKGMVNNAFSYMSYEVVSTRFPLDHAFTEDDKYNIIPDAEKNCRSLYEAIYGEAAPTVEAEKEQ